jgi:hypothetical protein
VKGFRVFALEHPDLFRLFFNFNVQRPQLSAESSATGVAAWNQLVVLVERAQASGLLDGHTVDEVTLLWDVLCTGLALREICGRIERSQAEQIWINALKTVLIGLGAANQAGARVTPKRANSRMRRGRPALRVRDQPSGG